MGFSLGRDIVIARMMHDVNLRIFERPSDNLQVYGSGKGEQAAADLQIGGGQASNF